MALLKVHSSTKAIDCPQHTKVPTPVATTFTLLPQTLHKYSSFSFVTKSPPRTCCVYFFSGEELNVSNFQKKNSPRSFRRKTFQ